MNSRKCVAIDPIWLALFTLVCSCILIALLFRNKSGSYDKYRCKTKQMALNGVITRVYGKASYIGIDLSNRKGIAFDIQEVIFKNGFDKFHDYEVGDSVIKAANSDTVFIRKDQNVTILRLQCDS